MSTGQLLFILAGISIALYYLIIRKLWRTRRRGILTGGGRWKSYAMLMGACLITLGSNGGYNLPSTILVYLEQWFQLKPSQFYWEYNLMYSSYSWLSIFLPIYLGHFIERWGIHSVLVLFTGLIATGVGLYSLGVQDKTLITMLMGRVILGVGAEGLSIAQSSFVNKHFSASELSFALAVTVSFGRWTHVSDFFVYPFIAERWGTLNACWFAFFVALGSMVVALLIRAFDERRKRKLSDEIVVDVGSLTTKNQTTVQEKPVVSSASLSGESTVRNRSKSKLPQKDETSRLPGPLSWLIPSYFYNFPTQFWLLIVSYNCFMISTTLFLTVASGLLTSKYFPDEPMKASTLVSVPDTLSALVLPVLGYLSDKMIQQSSSPSKSGPNNSAQKSLQSKARQIQLGGFLQVIAHLLMASTNLHPSLPLILLGLGCASYSSVIYSLMAELVRTKDGDDDDQDAILASAYGASSCIANLTFAIAPLLIGAILAKSGSSADGRDLEDLRMDASGYQVLEYFFASVALIGILAARLVERMPLIQ